ncbi:putative transcriptional regulator, LysR family [Advenella mimigardefordensis DPN7]|uniref:Putative transcriptional regulator, LysR family n=1 Tax=Advenella mimigardefordensis (strain DSM 17166 / LMG 22922 / DPN7) TaxID=1247726 RepID=W0PFJ4_ADVMD|nr:putative transcriptional regulator, LysR family [Advenella mimigardefordensis DPN7]
MTAYPTAQSGGIKAIVQQLVAQLRYSATPEQGRAMWDHRTVTSILPQATKNPLYVN